MNDSNRQAARFLPFTRPTIDEETIAAVAEVLRSGWLASGPKVAQLEAELSAYCGGRPVRSQTSATAGLEMALLACGIGAGDEVITPALSFVATANVIMRVGARPVFVDVGLDSRNLDLEQVEAAITPRTRAIMPVHFAGLPVDMAPVYALAKRRGLRVIEDAAHTMGASYGGRRIGAQGDLVSFSFHPNKNLTTIEGGALTFADAAEVEHAERLRFHGIRKLPGGEMEVEEPGGKFNMPDVCAAIGLAQLARLEEFNARRRELARLYFERLQGVPHLRLPAPDQPGHCWHLLAPLIDFAALGTTRRAFIEMMQKRGIGVGVHYQAMHLFAAYRRLGYKPGDFPNAETIGARTLTLPLFTRMQDADVDRVCSALREAILQPVTSNGHP